MAGLRHGRRQAEWPNRLHIAEQVETLKRQRTDLEGETILITAGPHRNHSTRFAT